MDPATYRDFHVPALTVTGVARVSNPPDGVVADFDVDAARKQSYERISETGLGGISRVWWPASYESVNRAGTGRTIGLLVISTTC